MAELHWLTDGDGAWRPYAELHTRFVQEVIAGERPTPVALLQAERRHAPTRMRAHHVLALDGGEPVGAAAVSMDDLRPQSAAMWFLYVVPERRRRGVGTCLLDGVRDLVAGAGDRTMLRTSAPAGVPAGAAFARQAGGRPGLVLEQNRCPAAAIDPDELSIWRDRATERAADYSLVSFDGVCPEEHLAAFAAAIPIMNTAPRAEGTEDLVPSTDDVRDAMAAFVRVGNDSWTVCARDDRTGAFVGYTELSFSHLRPWRAKQGDTGVHPDHRDRGIGRWLKATTGLRMLGERPEVEFVETWNAARNAAMLSINRAMGFEVVARWQEWILPVREAGPAR